MKINFFKKFTVGNKIAAGYVIVLLLAGLSGFFGVFTLGQSRVIDNKISDTYIPFLTKLVELDNMTSDARKLTRSWIYSPNVEDKNELKAIHDSKVKPLLEELSQAMNLWEEDLNIDSLEISIKAFEANLELQNKLMVSLQEPQHYEDIDIIFPAIELFDEQLGPELIAISKSIVSVKDKVQIASNLLIEEKYASFDLVKIIMITLTILAIIIGSLASYLSTKSIVNPIRRLNEIIKKFGLGELPEVNLKKSGDEIGDMIESITNLRNGLNATSNFAFEIGEGNLQADFQLLSDSDVLGKSLIAMRNNLNDVINETKQVVKEAGMEGKLNARMNNEGKSGAWEEMSGSINSLLQSISMPILTVNEIVNAMSRGDLTQRYTMEAKGEVLSLAQNLNSALDSLNGLLHQIANSTNVVGESSSEMLNASEEMTSNTGEIASAIAQMSSGAQTQVSKVDETSSLIEGILRSSNEMGERAETINNGVNNVVDNSVEGEKMLDKVVSNMAEISTYSTKTHESIKVLTLRSDEISRVLGVITEIASQTNLLALNAAIEAAQAGDAGRGFAVVAEEIRKLAEDSRNSAREIEKLIGDVQSDTKEAVNVIETMNTSVKVGETITQNAVEIFKTIAGRARNNLTLSQDILKATKAQENDITVIVSNTENIVVIAEQTAAGTEEVASSATELSSGMENYSVKSNQLTQIATELKIGVDKFKLSVVEND